MCHERRAFTLVEILTVTVIIALVVAVLVPTVGAVRRQAKTVMCANNLRRLSQAVGTRRSDELQRHVSQFSVTNWRVDLAPYLPLDPNDLVCPEYDPGDHGPPVGAQYRFRLYNYVDIEYFFDLEDSPSVIKMSDTQYRQARAAGYLRHGMRFTDYTGYQGYEDDNSSIVWYAMEESTPQHQWQGEGSAASADHEEVRMRITDNGDGTIEMAFERGSICIVTDVVPVDGGKAVATFYRGSGSPPDPITVPGSTMDLGSYGVNANARRLLGGGKILAIDYIWTAASVKHTWATMPRGERPDLPVFARHRGQMNVASMDGSVRLMQPEDLDPANEASTAYWLP